MMLQMLMLALTLMCYDVYDTDAHDVEDIHVYVLMMLKHFLRNNEQAMCVSLSKSALVRTFLVRNKREMRVRLLT